MARERWAAWTLVLALCVGVALPRPQPADAVQAGGATLRVAYPDVPSTWSGLDQRDTAALDLFALWGLPLFRVDPAGQLRPGLGTAIVHPEDVPGWAVDVDLAWGRWSDGAAVTAQDVVATAGALALVRPEEWQGLTVTAVDEDTVRFSAEEPMGRWAYLLSGAPGVLPAGVLADGGLEAYATDVPVSGGWFRLTEQEPQRGYRFAAHPDGPLGAPAADAVDVAVVPSYESALGLLVADEVDVALGHLALNAVARAEELDGISGGAPLGGTWVSLEWQTDGRLADDPAARRSVADALELSELVGGLLGEQGAPASSPVPGVSGPWGTSIGRAPARAITRDDELVLLVPRWHEALGFTARVLQRDVRAGGGALALIGHESPILLDPPERIDVAMRVRRSPPRPALGLAGDDVPVGPDATVADELAPVFEALRELEEETPLYRIGVAHAWRDGLIGVRPSSWPGLALWEVGRWQLDR